MADSFSDETRAKSKSDRRSLQTGARVRWRPHAFAPSITFIGAHTRPHVHPPRTSMNGGDPFGVGTGDDSFGGARLMDSHGTNPFASNEGDDDDDDGEVSN